MRKNAYILLVLFISAACLVHYRKDIIEQAVPRALCTAPGASCPPRLTPASLNARSLLNLPHPAEVAVAAAPLISGFLPKAGPSPLNFWLPPQELRHTNLARYLNGTDGVKLAVHQDGVSLPTTPPLFPYCMIYVNHRYKFIYVRHPKSASSTLMNYFTFCGELTNFTDIEWEPAARSRAAGAQQDAAAAGGVEAGSEDEALGLGSACLGGHGTFARDMTPEQARAMWEEYFVFSVVRNPFTRMVSAYKFLLEKMKEHPQCERVRWGDFCADPLSMGTHCQQHPHCCAVFPDFYWHHVIDQGRCIETETGNWALDYLVSVEQFDQQMPEVIREINRRRDPRLPPLEDVTRPLQPLNVAHPGNSKQGCLEGGTVGAEGGAGEAGWDGQQQQQQGEGEGGGATSQADREAAWLRETPRAEKVLVTPPNGWVYYNASILLDRHCRAADYYRGANSHCLAQIQHFHAPDFKAMYPAVRTSARAQAQQGQRGLS